MTDIATSYAEFQTLRITSPSEHVLHVELNRPKQMNSMNHQFWHDMRDVFRRIRADTNVRAVVISGGECRMFTAGLDLKAFGSTFTTGDEDPARKALNFLPLVHDMQESFTAIENCMRPVIVAVHGACIGGGIDLITACDIRFATKDAFFSIKEVDIGLAADIGTLQRLPKVVGNDSWVRELAFTGRNFGVAEALQFGLVSKIVENKQDLVAEAIKTATFIATKSPIAVVGTKQVLNYSRDHTTAEGLQYVGLWNAAMTNTQDIPIAIQANLAKTKPVFPKL
ncbi:uncharacterized protein SPPG_06587 [Spizellomyces punctatus DAOM BR117]|uniref:Enoyl-CoA hydratase/isomerase n=1 Tax=Spizellomyces punctatus (strain DAOM BR117) TaxID=645134 RepID=A0A0L0HBF0_SPIPD|nr:uncharacterized protein SPPG_06587 [Spizellomyces punctatus DAOM BR117]KNC98184.1 hypothetical protein SPPG_06587 [Spizellomyces punctatus DAOM BR117]|eukprot:XP_016606224.1 hypothetical protein SPPG_06587 [Spizellomyces punctatus DAOM BR117]